MTIWFEHKKHDTCEKRKSYIFKRNRQKYIDNEFYQVKYANKPYLYFRIYTL